MRLRKGERWVCQNPACGSEVLVVASSEMLEGRNPCCSCGHSMKKLYVKPGLTICELCQPLMQTQYSGNWATLKLTKYWK